MEPAFDIRPAGQEQLLHVRELFTEYAQSLSYHICFESFERELAALPDGYSLILLAYAGERPAGSVAVRALAPDVCEMKRLYVREPFRGTGVGRALAERAIAWAREEGFRVMRLDTLPERMAAALSLYRRLGFRELRRDGEKLDMELRLATIH